MSERTAYPLSWPVGWPKTQNRQRSKFKTSLEGALRRLKDEIRLMDGESTILSSNYTLGAANPKDPGVVAYFDWLEVRWPKQIVKMAIPCDRWDRIEDNVHAIALTIEAMRGMERWGAKHMIKAMFTGFKELPPPGDEWWKVLAVDPSASEAVVRESYRALVKKYHPDAGGNADEFRRVQAAFETWERK